MSIFRKFIALLFAAIFLSGPGIAAVGSWNGVAFTAWNGIAQTAWNGTGISCASASSPSWGGEIASRYYALGGSGDTTSVITTNTDVPSGSRIILFIGWFLGTSQTISSISDGTNTYAVDKTQIDWRSNSCQQAIASVRITSQLNSGASITITWGSPATSYRYAIAGYEANAAVGGVDQTGAGSTGGTSPSASITPTATPGLAVGFLQQLTQVHTWTPAAGWSVVGAAYDPGASTNRMYVVQNAYTGTSAIDPAGTQSGNEEAGLISANYP